MSDRNKKKPFAVSEKSGKSKQALCYCIDLTLCHMTKTQTGPFADDKINMTEN